MDTTARFVFERETKNAVRFNESGSSHIGVLYVQKASLTQIGWAQGKDLQLTLAVAN